MICVLQPVSAAGDFAKQRASDALWVTKNTTKGIITITANMCKEVGGLRSLAGMISSIIGALDLCGYPVEGFKILAKTCDSASKGLGGVHVMHRIEEFASGNAYKTSLFLASRITFLVKDTLSFISFLEDLALISAQTCSGCFSQVSDWIGVTITAKSISPTFEFMGWGLDTANNINKWHDDIQEHGFWATCNPERGLTFALDLTKLTAICLASSTDFWLRAVSLGARFGMGAVKLTTLTIKHVYPSTKAAAPELPPVLPANSEQPSQNDTAPRVEPQQVPPSTVPVEQNNEVIHPFVEEGSNTGSHA